MAEAYGGEAAVLERLSELERVCEQARRASDRCIPQPPRAELHVRQGQVTVLVRSRALPLWDEEGATACQTTNSYEHVLRYDSRAQALQDLPGRLERELERAREQKERL